MPRRLDAKQARDICDRVRDVMGAAHRDIPEIFRRGEHEARDGYPSSSMGGNGGQGISKPTEQVALAGEMYDPTGQYIEALKRMFLEQDQLAKAIDSTREKILATGLENRGRVSSVDVCRCCDATVTGHGEDRLKTGYCPPCRAAWTRFMKRENDAGNAPASHSKFIKQRREYLDAHAEKQGRISQ